MLLDGRLDSELPENANHNKFLFHTKKRSDVKTTNKEKLTESFSFSLVIGTLQVGGVQGLWKTPKYMHYAHEREWGCQH